LEDDVHVVGDVLDREVMDRNGRAMGRVDGILLEVTPGQPPRLAAILIGPAALGHRLHPRLGRLVERIERWWALGRNRPARIDFRDIEAIGRTVRLRLTVGETEVDAVEQRLRRWVLRIPGSR
jgi:sporulation protein YlmC with PRC-barrel domain